MSKRTLEKVCEHIAVIAAIPLGNRRSFCLSLGLTIEICAKYFRDQRTAERRAHHWQSLKKISKATEDLADAMQGCTDGAAGSLYAEWIDQHEEKHGRFRTTDEGARAYGVFLETVINFVDVVRQTVEFSPYGPRPKGSSRRRGKGRPRGTDNYPIRLLVLRLMSDVAEAGGELELDQQNEECSLIAALECCKPILPADFFTKGKVPSPSTLYRILSLRAQNLAEHVEFTNRIAKRRKKPNSIIALTF